MFREQGGSEGRTNPKHNTEKQRSNAQVVAMNNFAVISAECRVGLADTEKKTGCEHRKISGLAYCMMQQGIDINSVYQGAYSCQWLSFLVLWYKAAGPRVRQEFPVLVNLYCPIFLSLGLSGNSLFCTGLCSSCCCCCQQKFIPPLTMMDVLFQLLF